MNINSIEVCQYISASQYKSPTLRNAARSLMLFPVLRLGAFNVENLFRRPKAINTLGWNEGKGKEVLAAYAALEDVLQEQTYGPAEKQRILDHLKTLGLLRSDDSQWAFLRRSRGELLRRPRNGPVEVIASGRGDWIGWLELKKESVNEVATRNTARKSSTIASNTPAFSQRWVCG